MNKASSQLPSGRNKRTAHIENMDPDVNNAVGSGRAYNGSGVVTGMGEEYHRANTQDKPQDLLKHDLKRDVSSGSLQTIKTGIANSLVEVDTSSILEMFARVMAERHVAGADQVKHLRANF